MADQQAIRQVLASKGDEPLLDELVDKKGEKKTERRVIVIGRQGIYSFVPGGKLAREGHYINLLDLKSDNAQEVNLTFKDFKLNFASSRADHVISVIRLSHRAAFGGSPLAPKLNIQINPSSRFRELEPLEEQPLGGYINTYKTMCSAAADAKIRPDIEWDLENLFIPRRITDFNLKEFESPIATNELKPLLAALQMNTHFKSFIAKRIPFEKADIMNIIELLKHSTAIEQLVLQRNNLNREAVAAIADAMAANKALHLTRLSLDDNAIEDKGMLNVSNYISTINRGLVHLTVARCGISKAGIASLGNALKKNSHMTTTLSVLDISGNKFEADGSAAVAAFLAGANALTRLNLSNSLINPEVIFNAIIRGCSQLKFLDLSGNKMTKKDVSVLNKFLQSATQLSELTLSNTQMPPECVGEILMAISNNPYMKEVKLYLGENKFGLAGARVISTVVNKLQNIQSIDLRDNEFGEEGVTALIHAFLQNSCVKHLNIDANFKTRSKEKSKNSIEHIISLINAETALESLSISGGPKSELRLDVLPLIYELGTNTSLKSLDISGHQMGNKGAAALGKALQTNETLETLKWDGNLTTGTGFASFLIGLKRNFKLKNMPMPVYDIGAALRGNEIYDITRSVAKMEKLILRNQSPVSQFLSNELASTSNQFAFLGSVGREEVIKVSNKIKASGRKIARDDFTNTMAEVAGSDQLITQLFNLKEESNTLFEMQLKKKLDDFVESCIPIFGDVKTSLVGNITSAVSQSTKALEASTVKRLQTSLQFGGKDLPEEEFRRILLGQAHTELCQKANTALHSTVTITSDFLYEKYLALLQDLDFEISQNVRAEETTPVSAAPVKTASGSQKPSAAVSAPTASSLKPPPVKKPPAPPSRGGRPVSGAVTPAIPANVEALPKVESTLEHAQKGKPMGQANRKPPTRKPRPAPPSASSM